MNLNSDAQLYSRNSRQKTLFSHAEFLQKQIINYSTFAYIPLMVVDRVANKMEYYLVRIMLCPMHSVGRSIPMNNSLSPYHFAFFFSSSQNCISREIDSVPHRTLALAVYFSTVFLDIYFFICFPSIRTNKWSRALSREMLCQINANQYWYQTKFFVGDGICFCFLLWFCCDRKKTPPFPIVRSTITSQWRTD